MLTIADIMEALSGIRPSGTSLIISEATVDSRQIIPAAMFVALPGERVDGHNYVQDAFELGANLALIQKEIEVNCPIFDLRENVKVDLSGLPNQPFCILVNDTLAALQKIASFWRSKLSVKVIGITGSIGKSTTKELTAEVLGQRYRTLKNMGNLNNEIGLPLTVLRLGYGHERAVLEMGFYIPGEIALLCELAKPSIGVVTNIGPVHAERAGTKEEIAKGKAELIQSLPPAPEGVAILNYDDPLVRPMASLTEASIFYYGLSSEADLWADEIEGLGLNGIRFRLHYHNESIHIKAPLIGRHSVQTALRAAAVGIVEGLTWQEIVTGLQHGRNQLRLVAVFTEKGAMLLDDSYNSSPESALAALNLLNEMEGRKVAVLGDMLELGPYEKQGHVLVGERAAEVCDELVAIGSRCKIMTDAARKSGMADSAISWFPEAPDVIDFLKTKLKAGDIALIKGSLGMGMSRIVTALEDTSND